MAGYFNATSSTKLTDMDYKLGATAYNYPDTDTHISHVYDKDTEQYMFVVWFWACTGLNYTPYLVSKHDTYEEALTGLIAFNKAICKDFSLIRHNADYTEVWNA